MTIGIEDDELPENDETILVELREAGGGSVIGAFNAVTIIVMANDYVAGLLSFSQTAYLVREGIDIITKLSMYCSDYLICIKLLLSIKTGV